MDVSEDLGSPHPLTVTAPAFAYSNPNSSTNSSSHNKSATSSHVQNTRSPVRMRPPLAGANIIFGSSYPAAGKFASYLLFLLQCANGFHFCCSNLLKR